MVSLPPGSNLGRYQIADQLGRGGMATVFRAHDPALDRDVAVKVLPSYYTDDPTFVSRFSQEAQTIAKLSHPNILQIYDFGEDKGFTYIVAELVSGGTLQDKMRGEPLSLEDTLRFMTPLAQALDYAHSQKIVHRDLKPSNVLLDEDSRPILADFGLARMLEAASRFTQTQAVLGTPQYMSPEQALGSDVDHRSDLYALGVMLYEMLVGRTPFRGDSPTATLMAHIHQPVPPPSTHHPDLDPALESLLLKALAKDPDDRFSTASEMLQSMTQRGIKSLEVQTPADEATAAMDTGSATITAPPAGVEAAAAARTAEPAPTPLPRRRPIMFAAGGLAIAVVAVVAALLVMNGGGAGAALEKSPLEEAALAAGGPPAEAPMAMAEQPQSGAAVPQPTETPATEETPTPVPSTPTPTPAPPTPTPSPAAPTPTPLPTITLAEALASLEQTISQVQSRVVSLRQLTATEEMDTKLRTTEQLATLANGMLRRDYVRDQVFETEQLYKALGLLSEGDDLEEITRGIFLQQVPALFDDETGAMYVLSDAAAIGPLEELAYAAVYMGGLQQQRFDVEALRREARDSGNLDRYRAVNAFVQGEVAQIQEGYVSFYFSEAQVEETSKPLPGNLLSEAPYVVREAMLFPQREGSNFVAIAFGSLGSWDAVNSVYGRPPLSTEQILHPEKYFEGEGPVIPDLPAVEASFGPGWDLVSLNTMGEFLIRTTLEVHIEILQAETAAAGWEGDRYALLTGPEGERVLVLVANWDSADDSDEFFEAFEEWASVAAGEDAIGRQDGTLQRWSVGSDRAIFIRKSGPTTLAIVADSETLAQRALSAFGGP